MSLKDTTHRTFVHAQMICMTLVIFLFYELYLSFLFHSCRPVAILSHSQILLFCRGLTQVYYFVCYLIELMTVFPENMSQWTSITLSIKQMIRL